jgi:hypothetical protein
LSGRIQESGVRSNRRRKSRAEVEKKLIVVSETAFLKAELPSLAGNGHGNLTQGKNGAKLRWIWGTDRDEAMAQSSIGFQSVSFAPASDAFQTIDCGAGVVTGTCRRFVYNDQG